MDTDVAGPERTTLPLGMREIHLFRVDLDDERRDSFLQVLNDEELARIDRFRTRELQRRHARCRGTLRVILGLYEGIHPRNIVLQASPWGKPELPGGNLYFNLAHSEQMAVIAVCRRPIGVDIECMRHAPHVIEDVAQDICHPSELAALHGADENERRAMFYRLWTRKEAYSKAIGTGLNEVYSHVRFLPLRAESAHYVNRDVAHLTSVPFFAFDIPAPQGYAASVCAAILDPNILDFPAPVECPFLGC